VFLAIAAVLAWLFGAALLFAPADFYKPTGIDMTPMLATVAQAHGATLIGLGVVDWLGRNADRQGILALLVGNLVVQVLSLGVVLRTMYLGAGAAVAPGVVIHVVLGSLFAFFLVRLLRSTTT
jgi:asparagine N-glycosylation enzyme membrane subunit Stt3